MLEGAPMKRIPAFLSVLILLILSACELPMPGAEAPPAPNAQPAQPPATLPAPTAPSPPLVPFAPRLAIGEPEYENPMRFPNYGEWTQAGGGNLRGNRNPPRAFKDGQF